MNLLLNTITSSLLSFSWHWFCLLIAIPLMLLAILSFIEGQQVKKQLETTLHRERLLNQVSQRIRQSLQLEEIAQMAVVEVHQLLKADRVYVAYFNSKTDIEVIAESLTPPYSSILGCLYAQELLALSWEEFQSGTMRIIKNTADYPADLKFKDYYAQFQIQAVIVIPLRDEGKLIGVLVVHQCDSSRHWQSNEIELLEQLSNQITIAIQQAHLYQKVRELNANLETQVQERNSQLTDKTTEVQKLSKMRNICLQAVAHDLQTSSMAMLMILKTLEKNSGETVIVSRKILDRMIVSCDRQLTLMNAVSEGLDSESRQLLVQCESLIFPEIIQSTLNKLQKEFTKNQISIQNNILKNIPNVSADPSQIQRLLEQLLINAIKHNPPGIQITLTAQVREKMLYCEVIDNGVGMNQPQRESLFGLYVRNLYNCRLTGVGLGSYLCSQIIKAHGGSIGVESQLNTGTKFWFTLPLAMPHISHQISLDTTTT